MKKTLIPIILLALLAMVLPVDVLAQVPGGSGPPGGGGPGGCFPNPCVPIDGGISFLVAAGLALGGKKLYDSSKK